MANTKQTIIDGIGTALTALSGINLATRDHKSPKDNRVHAPYVGIVSMNEAVIVDDGTNIRWGSDLELILMKKGDDIEKMIDIVKDAMLVGMAATVGALEIRLVANFKVAQVEKDPYSSSRMFFEFIYVSTKGAA